MSSSKDWGKQIRDAYPTMKQVHDGFRELAEAVRREGDEMMALVKGEEDA